MKKLAAGLLCTLSLTGSVQAAQPFDDKFRQLEEILPTPNTYRTASGAPGHEYWQQQADYKINIQLDEKKRQLTGSEIITYYNNSPDTLRYVWVQLDQNRFKKDSDFKLTNTVPTEKSKPEKASYKSVRTLVETDQWDGGFKITKVANIQGKPYKYTINKTMMRIDLAQPLKSGDKIQFAIDWNYLIREQKVLGGRAGYEHFEEDGNDLYEVAQWFPRMAAYYDAYGWQNKQFLGRGEFTLEFGDYDVKITVPADHIVASTGQLQNPEKVLTKTQMARLEEAKTADKPVLIVTQDEAISNEEAGTAKTKTWHFKAKDVRDFAWASSRKFIWDAQGYKVGNSKGLAMSYYPKEGNPLWEMYSTQAIIHTIEHYNKYSLEYPYPVAISVNGPVGGMEYPMISFNGPRPEKDPKTGELTWSKRTKYGLIGVIIHEVGHNYYPMIINSDERQWTWMDEGLNTFVQFLAEQAWEENYPSRRGEARKIVDYMRSDAQVPIMTNSESILQFGNNAYGKPATSLNILRETIMGRELFDFAFKEYAERWKFKRPTPADFFRTMEDASGVDLDWFWRGWFYTTDHVDISLDAVTQFTIDSKNPEVEDLWKRQQHQVEPKSITQIRNQGMPTRIEARPELNDFYNEHDDFTTTNDARNKYNEALTKLEPWEKALLKNNQYFYQLDFSNLGGLVMPIILQIQYADQTQEELRIPAEIWRRTPEKVSKMLIRNKQITAITLDPHWETADTNVNNNHWPAKVIESKLKLFKKKKQNLMKEFNQKLKDKSEFNQ